MAGIFLHFIIGCIIGFAIIFLFFNPANFFPLAFFVLGNIIPDLVFIPFLVLKYRTVDAKKILKTRLWKVLSHWDEIIFLLISIALFSLFSSFEMLMFLFGVISHILTDVLFEEENLWW